MPEKITTKMKRLRKIREDGLAKAKKGFTKKKDELWSMHFSELANMAEHNDDLLALRLAEMHENFDKKEIGEDELACRYLEEIIADHAKAPEIHPELYLRRRIRLRRPIMRLNDISNKKQYLSLSKPLKFDPYGIEADLKTDKQKALLHLIQDKGLVSFGGAKKEFGEHSINALARRGFIRTEGNYCMDFRNPRNSPTDTSFVRERWLNALWVGRLFESNKNTFLSPGDVTNYFSADDKDLLYSHNYERKLNWYKDKIVDLIKLGWVKEVGPSMYAHVDNPAPRSVPSLKASFKGEAALEHFEEFEDRADND